MSIEATKVQNADLITSTAAQLSVVEMAMGSALHALHAPFAGHLLSLNEGIFLAHASSQATSRRTAALACYEIAGVAAAMKSLAPATKKLGPMLSIMAQGLLFALGILLGGRQRFGQILGFIFLSAWAFIQPIITLLVSFGFSELTQVLEFYQERLNKEYSMVGTTVFALVGGLYLFKCAFSIGLVFWLDSLEAQGWLKWVRRWQQRATKVGFDSRRGASQTISNGGTAWRGALRDLSQPLFIFSFALTLIFLFVQKESLAKAVWISLRPLGIAFIIFYLLRAPAFVEWLNRLTMRFALLKPLRRRFDLVRNFIAKT